MMMRLFHASVLFLNLLAVHAAVIVNDSSHTPVRDIRDQLPPHNESDEPPPAHVRRGACLSSQAGKDDGCKPSGLYADPVTCQGDQLAAVDQAIHELGLLATAALTGLSSDLWERAGNPRPYFFGPNPAPVAVTEQGEAITVKDIFVAAYQYSLGEAGGRQPAIMVMCADPLYTCPASGDELSTVIAYSTPRRPNTIILCDFFFHFPVLQPSCSGGLSQHGLTGIGANSRAQSLLHHFVRVYSVHIIRNIAYGTRKSHALVAKGSASQNADSFARYAGFAYDMGLALTHPGAAYCLDRFTTQNFGPGTGEFPTDRAWLRSMFGAQVDQAAERWRQEKFGGRNVEELSQAELEAFIKSYNPDFDFSGNGQGGSASGSGAAGSSSSGEMW